MKLRVSLAISGLLLTVMPATLAVTPKSGVACKKLGNSSIYQGKKFTCVKSGKKLVWSKGVLLKRNSDVAPIPAPTNSSSQILTPTPTPTPTPTKSEPSEYEKNLSAFESVSRKSFNLIRESWPTKSEKLTIKYHFTENFPKDILDEWKLQASRSVDFYDQFIDSKQIFNVYFVTNKDQAWVEDLGFWNPENFTFFQYWEKGLELSNCQGAMAWFLIRKGSTEPELHGGIAISSAATYKNMSPWCQHVISHEMFHAVQDYWLSSKQGNRGFASRDAYDLVEMPIFREGSADAISTAIGQPNYERYLAAFKSRFGELFKGSVPLLAAIKDEDELVGYLKKAEIRSQFSEAHEASYFLGMTLFEYAIANYGLNKFIDLVKKQNQNIPFREAFQAVYGFPIDDMYRKSAGHILNAIKVVKPN